MVVHGSNVRDAQTTCEWKRRVKILGGVFTMHVRWSFCGAAATFMQVIHSLFACDVKATWEMYSPVLTLHTPYIHLTAVLNDLRGVLGVHLEEQSNGKLNYEVLETCRKKAQQSGTCWSAKSTCLQYSLILEQRERFFHLFGSGTIKCLHVVSILTNLKPAHLNCLLTYTIHMMTKLVIWPFTVLDPPHESFSEYSLTSKDYIPHHPTFETNNRRWTTEEHICLLKCKRANATKPHNKKVEEHNATFARAPSDTYTRTREGCHQQMEKLVGLTPAGLERRIDAKIDELERKIADNTRFASRWDGVLEGSCRQQKDKMVGLTRAGLCGRIDAKIDELDNGAYIDLASILARELQVGKRPVPHLLTGKCHRSCRLRGQLVLYARYDQDKWEKLRPRHTTKLLRPNLIILFSKIQIAEAIVYPWNGV
ncbi:uncharacterized protein MYCFIDRAFT_172124 [Pseudocercospora fijiensis CIRAD86]|uniref:Uncharacterized protein n=1 Tax=Pseudocercospora fijiensis (strain CIRAD86) TaxID=383855 RepID=M3BAU8_PSEFD|nr:uncharacterized protein MYCFIDRAFT_172124 [Pseudocercospora fijiensis CIRAD86]EME86353.1 hypothetical protein MYCFIDRAFT_172124 [Pseudocercospora fijiensis CIRAD86]